MHRPRPLAATAIFAFTWRWLWAAAKHNEPSTAAAEADAAAAVATAVALQRSRWIVGGVTLLFAAVVVVALQQTEKVLRAPRGLAPQQLVGSSSQVSLTGGRTRAALMILLCLANLMRFASLLVMAAMARHVHADGSAHRRDDSLRPWLFFLVESLPSLVFISTFSTIVLFWAQVYYASVLYFVPLLRPIFGFVNFGMYCAYGLTAVLTLSLHAYDDFRRTASFGVELLFLVVAIAFAYFGIKVGRELYQSKPLSGKSSIIRWVLTLAVVCPLLFAPRGLYFLASAVGVLRHYYPPHLTKSAWDALVYGASEGLPSLLILTAFYTRRPAAASSRAVAERDESVAAVLNAPLIQYSYMDGANSGGYRPQQGPTEAYGVSLQQAPLPPGGGFGDQMQFTPQFASPGADGYPMHHAGLHQVGMHGQAGSRRGW